MRISFTLLLLGLLALTGPLSCQAELQQAAGEQEGQQQQQQAGGSHDITVEEAILQTYERDTDPQRKAHAKQQKRLLRQQEAQQAAEQGRLLEQQQRRATKGNERLATQQAEQQQAAALGRGSLRQRKQQQAKGGRPFQLYPPRKGDVFAEVMERQVAAVRQQRHAALLAAYDAAGAAAGQQQEQAQPDGQQQQQQQQEPALQRQRQLQEQQQPAAPGGSKREPVPLMLIVLMTVGMAGAAGIGALPFFFVRALSDGATAVATAVACGVMLAASFDLVHEGQPYGAALTVVGVLLGGLFIRWVQQHLEEYEDISFGDLQGTSARKTVLMVGIMAAHALGEGCAVGVSFCGDRGWAQGVLTTLAIGVHNIPEGLAKATVLVGQGVTPRRALLWSVATCLPQPLVAIPSFIFVEAFKMILPVALGFAAGCMIWMVFAELLPDALERGDNSQVATAATVAAAGLEGFRMLFASMEQADGSLGGGGAAAPAMGVLGRMGPPLLVLLPAVAAAAAGGGSVGGSALPAPVAWGLAAAVAATAGGSVLLDQLFWRPQIPMLHTAATASVGAALAVLLHRHLLNWAAASAGAVAGKLLKDGGAKGRGAPDVEALEYSSMYTQHHLHHEVHKQHHSLLHPPPRHLQHSQQHQQHQQGLTMAAVAAEAAEVASAGGSMNGFGGSSSSLQYQAPYHRGAGLPGSSSGSAAAANGHSNGTGSITPTRRGGQPFGLLLLPAPQLAAAAAAMLALAAGALATGRHLACALLLMGEGRSSAILPAVALLLAGPGLGAGALARTLPTRRGAAAGAWAGGVLAALSAVAAAVTVACAPDAAHLSTLVKSYLYPYAHTETVEAAAAGALCSAAVFCFAAGAMLKAPSARGGLLLGLAATLLLAALRMALCSFTPYCLSITVLLARP